MKISHKQLESCRISPKSWVASRQPGAGWASFGYRQALNLAISAFHSTNSIGAAKAKVDRYVAKNFKDAKRIADLYAYLAEYAKWFATSGIISVDSNVLLAYSPFVHSRLVPLLQGLKLPPEDIAIDPLKAPDGEIFVEPIADSKIALECGTTMELVDRVMRGGLHAGFGVSPVLESSISSYPIAREPFALAVSKNHRLARQNSILARDLDGEAVFFFPRASHPQLFDRTFDYIESTGATPTPRETASFVHTMEIVAHNFGVALLPRSASRFSHTGVLFKPIADKLLFIETSLLHSLYHEGNRIRWFLRELLLQIRPATLDR
jgi:hypothetical protein